MCLYVWAFAYVRMYMWMYAWMCTWHVYIHMYACMPVHTYTHTFPFRGGRKSQHINTYICAYMHDNAMSNLLCEYTRTYTHTHIHIYILIQSSAEITIYKCIHMYIHAWQCYVKPPMRVHSYIHTYTRTHIHTFSFRARRKSLQINTYAHTYVHTCKTIPWHTCYAQEEKCSCPVLSPTNTDMHT